MRPYPVHMYTTIRTKEYRALLHQTSRTYWEMRRPFSLIKPKCTEPFYTKPVQPIEKWGHTQCGWSPTIRTKEYRALLHQTSRTYWEMRRPSSLIKPKCTGPYYTKPIQPIEKWGHTQAICTPQFEPKSTEPYYTKPVEPIEKWGDPPPLSDTRSTETYYTKPVEPIEKWGVPPA